MLPLLLILQRFVNDVLPPNSDSQHLTHTPIRLSSPTASGSPTPYLPGYPHPLPPSSAPSPSSSPSFPVPLPSLHVATGVIGALVMVYAFLQRWLKESLLLSEALAASLAGLALGPQGLALLRPLAADGSFEEGAAAVLHEASRLLLALQLASSALSLPLHFVSHSWRSLLLLLGPGLLLSFLLSSLLTLLFFPHLGLLRCLWVGACLSPTDPVLASTVLQGQFAESLLPAPLRHLLQAESGANDGLGLPLVLLPLLLAEGGRSPAAAVREWLVRACAYQVGASFLAGLLYGLLARVLLAVGAAFRLIDEPSFLAHVIGLALGALGLLDAAGASGVLAVFVATVAFSHREPTAEEGRYDAINGVEIVGTIAYFSLLASFLPLSAFRALGLPRLALYGVAVLLLRRPPVLLALCPSLQELGGTGLQWAPQGGRVGDRAPASAGGGSEGGTDEEQQRGAHAESDALQGACSGSDAELDSDSLEGSGSALLSGRRRFGGGADMDSEKQEGEGWRSSAGAPGRARAPAAADALGDAQAGRGEALLQPAPLPPALLRWGSSGVAALLQRLPGWLQQHQAHYWQGLFAGFFGPPGVGAIFYVTASYKGPEDMPASSVVLFVVMMAVIVHSLAGGPCSLALNKKLTKIRERRRVVQTI